MSKHRAVPEKKKYYWWQYKRRFEMWIHSLKYQWVELRFEWLEIIGILKEEIKTLKNGKNNGR